MATSQPETRTTGKVGAASPTGLETRARSVLGGLADEELARRSANGDQECFAELVGRYKSRVFGLILSRVRVRADAEEAAQDTFLRAWRGIRTFDHERRFAAWIMTIAHRQAIDVIRRRKRDRDGLTRDLVGADSEPPVIQEPGPRVWDEARDHLKPDAFEALWLRYAEGCTPSEVARVMGKTSVWVRVTLHRSRAKLAEVLGSKFAGSGTAEGTQA